MDAFTVGILTLLAVTALFYIVFFAFIFYWHLTRITYVIVPAIFTFEFLITGFLIVAIVSIIIQFLPYLIGAAGI